MRFSCAPVQLGTCQHCWNYQISKEVVGLHPQCLPDLIQFNLNPGLQLFMKDVDRVVLIGLEKVKKNHSTNVSDVFLLGLFHNLIKGLHLLLRFEDPHEHLFAFTLAGDEGNHLINHIRLNIFFSIFIS